MVVYIKRRMKPCRNPITNPDAAPNEINYSPDGIDNRCYIEHLPNAMAPARGNEFSGSFK